jgi:hypothetical protein
VSQKVKGRFGWGDSRKVRNPSFIVGRLGSLRRLKKFLSMEIAEVTIGSIQYQIISNTEAIVRSFRNLPTALVPRNSVAFQGHCVHVTHFHATGSYSSLKIILVPHSLHIMFGINHYNLNSISFPLESLVFEGEGELQSIALSAFNTSSLRSIFIPHSVGFIGASAFWCSDSVHSLFFDRNSSLMQFRDGNFSFLRPVSSITIPPSVIQIFNGAFEGCRSLRSVTFAFPSLSVYFIGSISQL